MIYSYGIQSEDYPQLNCTNLEEVKKADHGWTAIENRKIVAFLSADKNGKIIAFEGEDLKVKAILLEVAEKSLRSKKVKSITMKDGSVRKL